MDGGLNCPARAARDGPRLAAAETLRKSLAHAGSGPVQQSLGAGQEDAGATRGRRRFVDAEASTLMRKHQHLADDGASDSRDELTPDGEHASRTQQRKRVPGDYTLTPILLSEPDMAWILCTNCLDSFCAAKWHTIPGQLPSMRTAPKLYGYIWPKTERTGAGDKEERILDHRTINRFLGSEEEAKAGGRQHWKYRLAEGAGKEGQDSGIDSTDEGECASPVRSQRWRRPSRRQCEAERARPPGQHEGEPGVLTRTRQRRIEDKLCRMYTSVS